MKKSTEGSIAPETGGDPAREKDLGKPGESPKSSAAPTDFDPLRDFPYEIFSIEGAPSKTNESQGASIAPETNEDPTQEEDPDKPDESLMANAAPFNFDPFRAFPDQIYGIEGAASLLSQQSQL